MFAKLKKKIEEETHADWGKAFATSSPNILKKNISEPEKGFEEKGLESSLPFTLRKGSNSTTDLYSCSSQQQLMTKTLSQDDLPGLQYKSDQVKRLEGKLKECSRLIQEYKKQKEKLEEDLEYQQTAAKLELESVIEEWKTKYKNLEAEKKQFTEKLEAAEQFKNKFVEKQDAIDELEGFQIQEMAKIKHMLLNCQQELQQSNKNLEEATTELASAKEKVENQEKTIEQLQKQLNIFEDERLSLKEQENNNKETIKELGESRSVLDKEVQQLRKELQQITAKSNQSEQMINNLQDENFALRHTHEIYCKQSITVIEEKESLVSHLTEKVELLEQRLSNCSLSEDSQLQSVISERDNLEKKLEEARQHVNDIKSTWSEKIMNLEKQISHLNEKMADDSEELVKIEKQTRLKEEESNEKINLLENQLQAATNQLQEITLDRERKINHLEDQVSSLKNKVVESDISHMEMKNELEVRLKKCQHEKDELLKEKEQIVLTMQNKIDTLETKVGDYLSERKNCEKKLKSLEENVESLKGQLTQKEDLVKNLKQDLESAKDTILIRDKKIEVLSRENEDQKMNVVSLTTNAATLEANLLSLKNEYEECQQKYQKLVTEFDLIEKTSRREKEMSCAKIADLESTIKSLEEYASTTQQQLQELEDCKKQNSDVSSQLQKMKESVVKLENEMTEKSKVIRLQQQRLNDMKKMLQKELKVHSLPSELSNGEISEKETFATLQVDNQTTANFMQHLQSLDCKPFTEDINFRYLKHVILKFMTSREIEAQHLIKAISVLLRFTPEEEQLVKDTLDWKMSWFGSKPEFGKGQMAKTIPIT